MTISSAHVLHGLDAAGTEYYNLTDTTPNNVVDQMIEFTASHPLPLFAANKAIRPEITFNTPDAAKIIAQCGRKGVDLSGGNLDLYYQQVDNLGDRVDIGTAAHQRLRASTAMLYIRQISARHREMATVDARAMLLYDGVNEPLIPAGSVSIPGAAATGDFFALGRVEINGVELDGIQQASLDLQMSMMELSEQSNIYDSFGALQSSPAQITLTALRNEVFLDYGLNGTALDGVNGVVIYLRKYDIDGNFVGNATPEHIRIEGLNGICNVIRHRQEGQNDPANSELQISLRALNSANDDVGFNVASAII